MEALERDIALTIISNGQSAYFSSVKGVGNLIWDTRLGVFSSAPPRAAKSLAFIRGTDWEDCTHALKFPLQDPVYGQVIIDFDQKKVVDANGWGYSNRIWLDWLERSIASALDDNDDGLVPKASLEEHFRERRIQLCDDRGSRLQVTASSLQDAAEFIAQAKKDGLSRDLIWVYAWIDLPSDWTHDRGD